MQLSTMIEGFWLARQRDMSGHTYTDYNLTYTRLAQYLKNPDVGTVVPGDIHKFLSYLADDLKLGAKTRSNAWTALSALWTWAETELKYPHLIRSHVPRPRYHSERPTAFDESEIRLILSAVDKSQAWSSRRGKYVKARRPTALRDRAIILTLLDTGLRVSELVGLIIADYDERVGMLNIRKGKGRKPRTVYVGQATRQALWKYLRSRSDVHSSKAPIFASKDGAPLDRIAVLRMVARAGKRAGVDKVHPHRFRHTFAITFLRNGGTPLELQRLLGHEKLETVLIYVELAQTDLQDAQKRASPADRWKL